MSYGCSSRITTFRIKNLGLASLWLIVLPCLLGIVAMSNAKAQGTPCPPAPSLQAPRAAPNDVCDGIHAPGEPAFDAFAWDAFKFLVWPAQTGPGHRGEPDKLKPITDMNGPRTFETLKPDWETFKPQAVRPSPWDAYPATAEPCQNQPRIAPGDLVLASYSEFGNVQEFDHINPGFTSLLVAQNQTYVRYLAAYNKSVFGKILRNGLYNPANYQHLVASSQGAPVLATTEPDGSRTEESALTIKSAWVELPKVDCTVRTEIERSPLYVRCAWLQDPEKLTCRKSAVGLVGLHIVVKTYSRPQWIWSTFEYEDNVPDSPERNAPSGTHYTFNNGNPAQPMTDNPQPSYQVPRPAGAPPPGDPPNPFQVERLQQLTPNAQAANAAWRQELSKVGSVWSHYKLVMVQWPITPASPDLDAKRASPIPNCSYRGSSATVNTTMETFLQTQTLCDGKASSRTCMTCHNVARKADFVWSIPMNVNAPARFPLESLPRVQALDALQSIVEGTK
jgi:hypothetical protein